MSTIGEHFAKNGAPTLFTQSELKTAGAIGRRLKIVTVVGKVRCIEFAKAALPEHFEHLFGVR